MTVQERSIPRHPDLVGKSRRQRGIWKVRALSAFLTAVIVAAWLSLGYLERHVRQGTGEALDTVVEMVQESVQEWAEGNRRLAEQWAGRPEIIEGCDHPVLLYDLTLNDHCFHRVS